MGGVVLVPAGVEMFLFVLIDLTGKPDNSGDGEEKYKSPYNTHTELGMAVKKSLIYKYENLHSNAEGPGPFDAADKLILILSHKKSPFSTVKTSIA